jgi:hypothetical protein
MMRSKTIAEYFRGVKKEVVSQEDFSKLIHFLHIGKCAGTVIKDFIDNFNTVNGFSIVAHSHKITLRDIPENSAYFFSIRDPITRFYSGFYSRKRKGYPRYAGEWTVAEERAFSRFPEANDLAENLFSDSAIGLNAFFAMKTIGHVNRFQHQWFDDIEEVLLTRPPLCILRKEFLEKDFSFLNGVLKTNEDFKLDADPVNSHRNDYSKAPKLSQKSLENLKIWYASDIEFYKYMCAWVEKNQNK